jgi:hypothetical protein
MWPEGPAPQPDTYAAFRGTFTLPAPATVDLLLWGESWFVAEVDGHFAAEGPTRCESGEHEAVAASLKLSAGPHVITAIVTFIGVPTRMVPAELPFLACDAQVGGKAVEVKWLTAFLPGYRVQVRRINPQLGWMEWCDTRQFPAEKSDAWKAPATPLLGNPRYNRPTIGPVKRIVHAPNAFSEDKLVERFNYELDDPPARFLLRDLHLQEGKLPPQGVWRRYDLDRVRLGRLAVTLDVPLGSIVEIAYAEHLTDGRVAPYITLSSGPSCNMDHFVARGGVQEFAALTPRGGRFAEVHVLADDPAKIKFLSAKYLERTYHDRPIGSFECDDELLNRIWLAGVETYRACSEDAIIDNPTRERGQWTGDAVVGMETASAAFDDLRLARRALVSAAKGARSDGLVSGLTPSTTPMSTYACQWAGACVRYHQLSGDRSLLDELFSAAVANFAALEAHVNADGLSDDVGWGFVDWGYARPDGPIDPAVNLHYLNALRAMIRWCELLKKPAEKYAATAKRIGGVLTKHLAGRPTAEYHVTALALGAGLLTGERESAAVEAMKKHILSCFPNNAAGPRLSDPVVTRSQIITPYFAHFAFPPLIERGQDDFVLDQYRKCWGWMLEDGRTTFTEVFDPRWSHCHQWSACPVWQLSRYVLALNPRFDQAPDRFEFHLRPGKLKRCRGRVPMAAFPGVPAGGLVDVEWDREGDKFRYRYTAPRGIQIQDKRGVFAAGSTGEFVFSLGP